jgi:flagellar hook-associated protein 2
MASGAVSFSGLSSGVDWKSMIDQLIQLDHKRVELVSTRQSEQQSKLKAWQDFNTKLLALKSAADGLRAAGAFNLYRTSVNSSSATDADDILTVSAGDEAVPGTYSFEILQTATAQKLSSRSLASQSEALGGSYAGGILVNGRLVTVDADDTLTDVRDKINALNSGANASKVAASIVSYSPSDYRLILSGETEGADGIGLQQVGGENVLQSFGFTTSANTIKRATSDGAESDRFSSSSTSVASLLGLSSAPSGNVTIGGQAVTIDLSRSLTQIAADIDGLSGVAAEVVSETKDGVTTYRIDVSGTTSFLDENNVLQSLGILRGTYGSAQEVLTSDTANTLVGGGPVTAASMWAQIDTGGGANTVANGDTITIRGTKHDGTAVSASYTINDRTGDTVQGLLDAIESTFGDVTASVTADGKIQVTDNVSGGSGLAATLISNNEGGGDLDMGTLSFMQRGYTMEIRAGQDARFKVDGNYLTRSSNTVTDAISGVTLNLLKAEAGTTVTVNVSRDTDGLTSQIKGFVDKYNDVMGFIATQQSYDAKNQKPGGVLFGDGTLSSVKSDIINNVVTGVWGVSSQFSILGMVGINLDNQGRLTVKEDTLQGYLRTNFDDMRRLFGPSGTTSAGGLAYVTYGRDTKPGTYAVNITQAATRGTVAGATDLSSGLSGDDTLTITVGTATARVSLTAGMTLDEIVSAINGELDSSWAESLVGSRALYADAGMGASITDLTTWGELYDDTGASAGLQNGDAIRFSGTDRSGRSVSGSYTIGDVNTDTVRGLLSAIEGAYNHGVIASIDASGRITVTDKTTGTSNLSVTITGPVGRNLDLGNIDVDPTGSDGSREGRYGMALTASASDDGTHLVLSHNEYGSERTFTVSQANGLVLGGGLDNTYAGLDVAGTINGEAAIGKGQRLAGSDGQASVDGLVVRYTGTSTGEVGSVTLTLGVAEAFYRSLFQITDSFEGYVTSKQTSIQSSIDRMGTQIESMEAQLERRRAQLTNQFVAMETLLSKLQNRSAWLAQQIESLQ